MEDILDVYQKPYDGDYPIVCIDEKLKALSTEKRPAMPPAPGRASRVDFEYKQSGATNLFIHFEPLTGRCHVSVKERRTSKDWADDMKRLADLEYPNAKKIILVEDNLNTHTPASFYKVFSPSEARRLTERFEFHHTPKHGSWLNMAEIALSVLQKECLARRFPDIATVEREVAAWELGRNQHLKIVDWRFQTKDARIKLKHLYPTVEPAT